MKVIHFTNNLSDGAGKAAYRLHKGLLEEGLESLMLTLNTNCRDDTVIDLSPFSDIKAAIRINKGIFQRGIAFMAFVARKAYWQRKLLKWNPFTLFNLNMPFISIGMIRKYLQDVDIICLYSVQGYLSSKLIRNIYHICKAPIVWTVMDIEPLTGGCHFNSGCDRFIENCGNCPQLRRKEGRDISRRIWNQKHKDYEGIPITFVAPTSHLCRWIKQSSLFRKNPIEKILLSVNKVISKKVDKKIAREALHLPTEKKIILFGCFSLDDPRKGGKYLLEALRELPNDVVSSSEELRDLMVLLTMGEKGEFDASDLPLEWIHIGEVNDDRILSLVYQSSDVLACPSIDDVGPMIINDAFACGIPVVAFSSGVAPDLIRSEEAGYVAVHSDVSDFRLGLFKCLFEKEMNENNEDVLELRKMCAPSFQVKQYRALFEELLATSKCV